MDLEFFAKQALYFFYPIFWQVAGALFALRLFGRKLNIWR